MEFGIMIILCLVVLVSLIQNFKEEKKWSSKNVGFACHQSDPCQRCYNVMGVTISVI